MKAARFLERSGVIRFFGFCLVVSPFVNAWLIIYLQKQLNPDLARQITYWRVLTNGTPTHYFLALCSLVIGAIMLQGSVKAWKYVLILLGAHIGIQLLHLGQNIRESWLWGFVFLINAGLFLFIADQIVWKIKTPEKPESQSPPPKNSQQQPLPIKTFISKQKVLVGFEGWGAWARMDEISAEHIVVKKIKSPPPDLARRSIEISFKRGITLKAHFDKEMGEQVVFKFDHLNKDEIQSMYSWIRKNAA